MKMKFFVIFIILVQSKILFSQVPDWQWAKSAGSTSSESGNSVTTDLNGNIYVAGYFFSSTISFGTFTLTNNGNYEAYIVKYDPLGNVLWAKGMGGIYDDNCNSVVTDSKGNVIISGSFYSPVMTIGTTTLTNAGGGDIFIVKYDTFGNEIWVKQEGGSLSENCAAVTTDLHDNIFITGFFKSASIVSGTFTLTNSGSEDFFIIKYDSLGNTMWVKSSVGSGNESGNALKTDGSGNVYVTGSFYNLVSFGTLNLTSLGSSDIFIIKYDTLGNEIWAKNCGGNLNDIGFGISTDANRNVFVIGQFLSTTFNYPTNNLTNAGDFDVFVLKYDSLGNELWAIREGGSNEDSGLGIVNDLMGNVYITGHFHSPSIIIGTFTFSNSGIGDCYFAQYNTSGNLQWAKSVGGTSDDGSSSIAINNSGEIVVTGSFYSPTIDFSNTTLTNVGNNDVFVAKMESLITGKNEKFESNQNTINLFPNPSNGEFIVNGQTLKINSINILNQLGEIVYDIENKSSGYIKIDASFLSKGIYYAIIKTDKFQESFKIIVQ